MDLSYEHLPPGPREVSERHTAIHCFLEPSKGGRTMAPKQGMALGIFLKYCSHLEELRLEGHSDFRMAERHACFFKGFAEKERKTIEGSVYWALLVG